MTRFAPLALLALAFAGPVSAAQIILDPTAVIGASSTYLHGAGNAGDMFRQATASDQGSRVTGLLDAGRIFDQQTGSIYEGDQPTNYWLAGDNHYNPGVANAYITIDLGGMYSLNSFDLFNTHNGIYNDRGTANFEILGANTLLADGFNGMTLGSDATTLVSGMLASEVYGNASAAAQGFASGNSASYRYIQFRALSAAASGPLVMQTDADGRDDMSKPSIAYGLNELRVFGTATSAVPEPASWAMMLGGFGLLGGAMRQGRRRNAAGLI